MAVIMPAPGPGARADAASGGQVVKGSCRFQENWANYLQRTCTGGNRRKWTASCWLKRGKLAGTRHLFGAYSDTNNRDNLYYGSGNQWHFNMKTASSWHVDKATDARFRDTGGWYHFCHVFDTPQSSATNRVRSYVNGVELDWGGGYAVTNPSQNAQSIINMNNATQYIGAAPENSGALMNAYFDGTLAQMNFIDGTSLGPENFGYTDQLTGIWRPKKFIPPYKVNKGQNWGGMCAGSTDSGYEYAKAFDGSDATSCYPSPGSTVTMTIPAGNLQYTTSFEAWVSRDANGGVITVNGGSDVNVGSPGFQIVDLSGEVAAGADITEITWARAGGGSIGLYMIYIVIDGVPLLDNDDTNYGGQGYFLPLDGSTDSIGKDQSGRGTDWIVPSKLMTLLPHQSYMKPILKTVSGGRVASSGVHIGGVDTPTAVTESGCVLFDGANDYLIGSSTSELLNDADWTVDGWFYMYEAPSSGGMIMLWDSGGGGNDPELGIWHNNSSSPGTIQLYQSLQSGTGWSGPSIEDRKWYYFKETVDGSSSTDSSAVYKLYLNGVLCNTTTINLSSRSGSSTFGIGCRTNGSQLWDGAISNLRYREVVDDSLGIPDGPFSSDSDTKLLCCQSSSDDTTATTIPTGSLSATGSPAPSTDEFSGRCKLALPLVGDCIDYSNRVAADSVAKTVTNNGATASYARAHLYQNSMLFDGSNDYLDTADHSDWNIGSVDATVEAWVWFGGMNGGGWDGIIGQWNNGNYNVTNSWVLEPVGSTLYLYYCHTGGNLASITGGSIVTGRWSHFAFVKKDNNIYLYQDGRQTGSGAITNTIQDGTGTLSIGGNVASGGYINGYIQDVRVYKGVAKYVSDFSLPGSFPNVVGDSPSGVSYTAGLGDEQHRPTHGSVSFQEDDSSYMQFDPDSDIAIGTGDFTIEAFVFHNGGADDVIISDNSGCSFLYGASGTLRFYMAGGSNLVSAGTGYISNRWVHVSASRSSGTLRMFQDGIEVYSAAYAHNISTFTDPTYIGKYHSGNSFWSGYINSLRVTVGQALYTGNYVPPSTPLTTTSQGATASNVKLLCCQSSRSAVEAEVISNAPTLSGGAQAGWFNPFDNNLIQTQGRPTGYPTLNQNQTSGGTVSNGNLFFDNSGSSENNTKTNTYVKGGKYYWEVEAALPYSDNQWVIGIARQDDTNATSHVGASALSWGWHSKTAKTYNGGTGTSYGSVYTEGSIIGCFLDLDNGTLAFSINGKDQGNTSYSLDTSYYYCPCVGGAYSSYRMNFGQISFRFPLTPQQVLDGWKPISCNTEKDTLPPGKPIDYIGVSKYSGSGGGTTKTINEWSFKPDLLIFKEYDAVSSWAWYDSLRGTSNALVSNDTSAEAAYGDAVVTPQWGGFTITGSSVNGLNGSSENIVAYGFKAGGNHGTFNKDGQAYASAAAAGLGGGDTTINKCSVGTDQGFSIIHYTGPNDTSNHTVAHGLTQAPDLIINKNLDDGSSNWNVYLSSFDSGDYMNMTAGATTTNGFNGAPTSTLINTQHGYSTDENDEFIAYCWHNVPGFQQVGKYLSTNNTNGPYIDCGFSPSQIVLRIDGSDSWHIFDNKRDPINGVNGSRIFWNSNSAQGTSVFLDFLCDGFKIVTNDSGVNGSDGTNYYYIAWAQESSNNLWGAQATARS